MTGICGKGTGGGGRSVVNKKGLIFSDGNGFNVDLEEQYSGIFLGYQYNGLHGSSFEGFFRPCNIEHRIMFIQKHDIKICNKNK